MGGTIAKHTPLPPPASSGSMCTSVCQSMCQSAFGSTRSFVTLVGCVTLMVLGFVATHQTIGFGRMIRPVHRAHYQAYNASVFERYGDRSCTTLMGDGESDSGSAPRHVPLAVLMFTCATPRCRERRTWQRSIACGVYREQSTFATCTSGAGKPVATAAGATAAAAAQSMTAGPSPPPFTRQTIAQSALPPILFRFVVGTPVALYERNHGVTTSRYSDAEVQAAETTFAALQREAKEFGDLLVLDVPDTHEEMFTKVLRAMRWVNTPSESGVASYDFLLKTDDDAFLRLPWVAHELELARRGSTAAEAFGSVDTAEWPLMGDDHAQWGRLLELNEQQRKRITRSAKPDVLNALAAVAAAPASTRHTTPDTSEPLLIGRYWRSHFTAVNRYEWWYPSGAGYILSRKLVALVLHGESEYQYRPRLPEDLAIGLSVFPYAHRPRDDARIHQWPTVAPNDPLTPRSFLVHYANTPQRVLWLLNYFNAIDSDAPPPAGAALTDASDRPPSYDARCDHVSRLVDSQGVPLDCDCDEPLTRF